jgi:hypothetical protein
MKNSDKKAKFRQTKEWKEFRKKIFEKQGGLDIITGKKLYKGWNLHHLDMSVENYDKLDEDNFIAVNKTTHSIIHDTFRYYKNDKDILSRLEQILDKMVELNR